MTENQASSQLGPRKEQIKFYADIVLKISPVVATLVLGFVTYQFQSKNAAANLLSQREQAETQLRTALFENLIGPVSGGSIDGPFDAEHQRLFVELLLLNFHEHIEFKPLLIQTDQRLISSEMEDEAKIEARGSLRSVVRRVRDRQAAMLAKECLKAIEKQHVNIEENKNPCEPKLMPFFDSDIASVGGKPKEIWSPNNEYKLDIYLVEVDWEELRVTLDVNIFKKENGKLTRVRLSSFSITPFDLPFTDNMLIYGQQRFALGVSDIAPERTEGEVTEGRFIEVKSIWFPEGYILPHERPVNHAEVRNMLNLED